MASIVDYISRRLSGFDRPVFRTTLRLQGRRQMLAHDQGQGVPADFEVGDNKLLLGGDIC